MCMCVSEIHSVMSDSLGPHGLYSPWNSPGQNTEVGSLSLLQGIFPTQGLPGIAGRFFTSKATREAQYMCISYHESIATHMGRYTCAVDSNTKNTITIWVVIFHTDGPLF